MMMSKPWAYSQHHSPNPVTFIWPLARSRLHLSLSLLSPIMFAWHEIGGLLPLNNLVRGQVTLFMLNFILSTSTRKIRTFAALQPCCCFWDSTPAVQGLYCDLHILFKKIRLPKPTQAERDLSPLKQKFHFFYYIKLWLSSYAYMSS